MVRARFLRYSRWKLIIFSEEKTNQLLHRFGQTDGFLISSDDVKRERRIQGVCMKSIFWVRQMTRNESITETLIQHITSRNIILDLTDNIRLNLHITQGLIFCVTHERRRMCEYEVVILNRGVVSFLDVLGKERRMPIRNSEKKFSGPEWDILEYGVLQG